MKKKNILICDDDTNLSVMLKGFLNFNNYDVTLAEDGKKGLEALEREEFDLVILDVMMPKMGGFELAKHMQENSKINVPIIFLTAKDQKEDVLKGYKMGATDYLTKPFDSELLLYKIEALMKHSGKTRESDEAASIDKKESQIFYFDKFKFVPILRELINVETNETIHLTPKESKLLQRFCENEKKLIKKADILNEIWLKNSFLNNRSMNVFLVKIRKYFQDSPNISIKSIYKVGYKFSVEGGIKITHEEE